MSAADAPRAPLVLPARQALQRAEAQLLGDASAAGSKSHGSGGVFLAIRRAFALRVSVALRRSTTTCAQSLPS